MIICLSSPLQLHLSPWQKTDRFGQLLTYRSPQHATFTDRCRGHLQTRRLGVPCSLSPKPARTTCSVDEDYDGHSDASPTTSTIRNDEGCDASVSQFSGSRPFLHLHHVSPQDVTSVIQQVEHDIVLSKHKNKRAKLGLFSVPNVELLLGLGLTEPQVVKMMGWNPAVLGYNTSAKIWPFLNILLSYGIDQPDIVKCLSGRWMVFSRDLNDVKSVLDFLTVDLGVLKLGKVIASSPVLLGYCSKTLKSTQRTLESVGIVDVGSLAERDPQVLTCSPKKLTENVKFIRRLLSREDVAAIIMRTPKVMWADAKTMEISAEKYILRWGEKRAFQLFEKYPNALTGAWGPKEEKLDYVEQVMGRSFEDILNCPSTMTYNLENRIKYRYELLERVGRQNVKLGSFLSVRDSVFNSRYLK